MHHSSARPLSVASTSFDKASPFAPLVLTALFLALSPALSSAQSFCQKVTEQLSLFKCPEVPTVDTVDLTKYTVSLQ